MKTFRCAAVFLTLLAFSNIASAAEPELDLQNGKFAGVSIGADKRKFAGSFASGGEWIGTWRAYKKEGYFVQPGGLRNMAGVTLSDISWPARNYGFGVYRGQISFGIAAGQTLEQAVDALKREFTGNFYVSLEEERGVWNRQYVAWQITGWKTDPPFAFEIYVGRNKLIDEIRLKSFPGEYFPAMLMRKATGPDAIDKKLAP